MADAKARIRALIEDRTRAIRGRDVNGSIAAYVPDVLLFDVVDPLRSSGSAAVRKRLADWFASFAGPLDYRRSGGGCQVTHEHASVPFDVSTGQTSLDLTP